MPGSHRDSQRQAAHRDDGLRRLSALTVGVALASAAATGAVMVAAQHASVGTHSTATETDTSTTQDGLRGPNRAPVPDQGPPAGLSSGS